MIREFEVKVPNKVNITIDENTLTINRKGFISFGNGLRGEKNNTVEQYYCCAIEETRNDARISAV